MTYVAVREDAAQEIISDRSLQSIDFVLGRDFIQGVQTLTPQHVNPRIRSERLPSGLVIFGNNAKHSRYVVIDVEQANLFRPSDDSGFCLITLQKALRFAIKFWSRSVLSPSEIVIAAESRAVIFPYPIAKQTGIRAVIDLAPDAVRMDKRGKSGQFLLLFCVSDEGGSQGEVASLATFRKAVEEVEGLSKKTAIGSAAKSNVSALHDVEFEKINSSIDPHQSFDAWMHYLTTSQKNFVEGDYKVPRRINGAAGTGKTVTMALAAIHNLRTSKMNGEELSSIFITHSESSRRAIETMIRSMGGAEFLADVGLPQRLRVVTLQGFCAEILRQDLSSTEFVDPDAYDAKMMQAMYVEEAIKEVDKEIETHERFMSPEFLNFIRKEDIGLRSDMLQHEIAVVIKGRACENYDLYRKVPSLSAGLPIRTVGDKSYVWSVYTSYRAFLVSAAQFDTDDVALSALGQLSTPIWRRRRVRDGFDAIFIDETHLFNMNELSIFHHLTRSDAEVPISFAVDRSQAIGDRGWTDDIDTENLLPGQARGNEERTDLRSIFRSAPEIVNLALAVTSSGASLFTNFENPMLSSYSGMSFEEEQKATTPQYHFFDNDESMIAGAFQEADRIREELHISRGSVAIIAFNDALFGETQRLAAKANKPVEILKRRGDEELVRKAQRDSRFVISMPEYVGGLEFDAVLVIGVDKGRVPPAGESVFEESQAFVNYSTHNKMYVALSRARYRAVLMGVKERGESPILAAAIKNGFLEKVAA